MRINFVIVKLFLLALPINLEKHWRKVDLKIINEPFF